MLWTFVLGPGTFVGISLRAEPVDDAGVVERNLLVVLWIRISTITVVQDSITAALCSHSPLTFIFVHVLVVVVCSRCGPDRMEDRQPGVGASQTRARQQ